MHQRSWIHLTRDCDAIQIPNGNKVVARAGMGVQIVHKLGNAYTVHTERGYMLRIEAQDADAMGLEVPLPNHEPATIAPNRTTPVTQEELWEQLKNCYDPEIPANIVELGLIYKCEPTLLDDGSQRVDVDMTLTAPGCGMGQVLKDDVERKLRELPGISHVEVNLVFDPPWDSNMMSEAARLTLGMF